MLRERGLKKQKDIKKAAAFLFREKGYYPATLEEVGNAVDLLAPSLTAITKAKKSF